MFSEIYSDAFYYSGMLEGRLERALKNNQDRKECEEKFKDICMSLNYLEDRLTTIQVMLREIPIVLKDYKEDRKLFIEQKITEHLEMVFHAGYEVKFNVKPYRDKSKATLELWSTNKEGKLELFIPSEQNGGLCRQVISASFGMAIAKLLKCQVLFLDEAFNGGDSVTLQKTQLLLWDWIQSGGIIILNEHNPMLYSNLPARIYEIEKSGQGFSGNVEVINIIDQEGSLDEYEQQL